MVLQQAHCFLYRSFELRVATGDYVFGPILHIDVWCHSFIFYGPLPVATAPSAPRTNPGTAINKRRSVGCMDQTTPGAFAYQQTNLASFEHIGHEIAA